MPKKLHWEDVINVSIPEHLNLSGEELSQAQELKSALEEWLCFIESTGEFGQTILQGILYEGQQRGLLNADGSVEKLQIFAVPETGFGSEFVYHPQNSSPKYQDDYRSKYQKFPPQDVNDRIGQKPTRFMVFDYSTIKNENYYYLDGDNQKQEFGADLLSHELLHAAGFAGIYDLIDEVFQQNNDPTMDTKQKFALIEKATTQYNNDNFRVPWLNKSARPEYYQGLRFKRGLADDSKYFENCDELTKSKRQADKEKKKSKPTINKDTGKLEVEGHRISGDDGYFGQCAHGQTEIPQADVAYESDGGSLAPLENRNTFQTQVGKI